MVFLFSFFIDWDIEGVKQWALTVFDHEEVAAKFEHEEIDDQILRSDIILTDRSMNNLGLTTIEQKNRFLTAVRQLSGKF